MSDFQWDESHVEWFVNFFTGNSDIKASSFGRGNIPRIGRKPVDKQDRQNLMELVVKKGLAIAVVGRAGDNSYCISLIPEDAIKLHFKHEMLFDDRINNLPDIAWMNHPVPSTPLPISSLLQWLKYKLIWLEIINLLRVYQVKGQIGKENLQQVWGSTMQKYLLIKAEEKVKLYTLVRLSWKQFDLTCEGLYQTPEDCFLDMLLVDAELMFFEDNVQERKSARQKYEDLRQIVGFKNYGVYSANYTEEKADEKVAELFRNLIPEIRLVTGEIWYPNSTSCRIFASGAWIMDLVKESNISEIEQAAKEYLEVKDLMMDHRLSIRNKKRKVRSSAS
jgi:hypothetical protein